MSELAPGVFESQYVPRGTCLVTKPAEIVGSGPESGFAIHPADWVLIPGAARERILDEITRTDAERGLRMIEDALSKIPRENTGGEG